MRMRKMLLFCCLLIVLLSSVQALVYDTETLTGEINKCIPPQGCADPCNLPDCKLDLKKIDWKTITSGQIDAILKTSKGKDINFNEDENKRKAFERFVYDSTYVALHLKSPYGSLKYTNGVIEGSFGIIDLKEYPSSAASAYTIEISRDENFADVNHVKIIPPGQRPIEFIVGSGTSKVKFRNKAGSIEIEMWDADSTDTIILRGPASGIRVHFIGGSAMLNVGDGGEIGFNRDGYFRSDNSYNNEVILTVGRKFKVFRGVFSFQYDDVNKNIKDIILKSGIGHSSGYYDWDRGIGFETTTADIATEGAEICEAGKETYSYCVRKPFSILSISQNKISIKGIGRYIEFADSYSTPGRRRYNLVEWEGTDTTSSLEVNIKDKKRTYKNIGKSKFTSPFWTIDSSATQVPPLSISKIIYTATIDWGGEHPKTNIDFSQLSEVGNVQNVLTFNLKYYKEIGCFYGVTINQQYVCYIRKYEVGTTSPAIINSANGHVRSSLGAQNFAGVPINSLIFPLEITYNSNDPNNIKSRVEFVEGSAYGHVFIGAGNVNLFRGGIFKYRYPSGNAVTDYYWLIAQKWGMEGRTNSIFSPAYIEDMLYTPWGTYKQGVLS